MASNGRVLVVDDHDVMRRVVERALHSLGYEYTLARDPFMALDAAQRNDYDLLLTDLSMPGMDGVTLLSEVRKLRPTTVAIVMTAQASSSMLRRDEYIVLNKPFTIEELAAVVVKSMAVRKQLLSAQKAQPAPTGNATPALPQPRANNEPVYEALRLDLQAHRATCAGRDLALKNSEYELLVCLMRRVDEIWTPTQLVAAVRGYSVEHEEAISITRPDLQSLQAKLEPYSPQSCMLELFPDGNARLHVSRLEKVGSV